MLLHTSQQATIQDKEANFPAETGKTPRTHLVPWNGAETEFSDAAREEAVTAFKRYWEQIDCAAQVRLSQYVVRRRAVLQALKKLLERRGDGRYPLQADIHDLIFPMGKTSDEVASER